MAIDMENPISMLSDVRRVLENLTSGNFMPYFDYRNTSFSFRTLFHSTLIEYSFCPCSYNHEYLNYISPKGDIDKEMFDKIVNCVADGNCPHVAGVPADHIQVSTVYAMHFVAALGTKEVINKYSDGDVDYNEMFGLFRIHPCGIAIMKKQYDDLGYFLGFLQSKAESLQQIPYAKRSLDDPLKIRINKIHLLELCILEDDDMLLTKFLEYWPHPRCLTKAFAFTLEHGSPMMEKIMLDHIKTLVRRGNMFYIYPCAEAAVMFNRVDVLQQIIGWLPSRKTNKLMEDMLCLFRMSNQLHRQECSDTINAIFRKNQKKPDYEGLVNHFLIYLKNNYDDYDSIRQDMVPVMKGLSKCKSEQYSLSDTILYCFVSQPSRHVPQPASTLTVKALLDCGVDINCLLKTFPCVYPWPSKHGSALDFRYKIEMILSANLKMKDYVDMNTNRILVWCLEIDEYLYAHAFDCYQPGDYFLNMRSHSHSCHTEQALYFMVPLLTECGYRFKTDEMLKAVERRLHCEEIEFIKQCISVPRPLQKQCRDVLRQHFEGSYIHAYVERTCVPLKIKHYILLTDVLLAGSISVKQ